MRRIVNIASLLLIVTILSFTTHHNCYPLVNSHISLCAVPDFVVFSMNGGAKSGDKNMRLDFYYHDSLAYGHPVTVAAERTKLLLNGPTLLLEASDKQTPFLIYPGEKINIKYAGSDSIQMLVAGNQQRTNELNFFRKLVQYTGNIYYGWKVMPYIKKVNTINDVNASEKLINNIENIRLQFLRAFIKRAPVGSNFIKIAVNSIKSAALNDSLLLFYNNRELLIRQNLYKKLIAEKSITINRIGFLPFQIYYRACNTLVSMATANRPDYFVNNSNSFIKRFDFIEKNFSGITKDFLMSSAIYAACTSVVPISKIYVEKFNAQCLDEGYKTIIDKKLNEKRTLTYPKGANNLVSVDGKTVRDIQTVLSKYKGKMALVDFWASWCSPCRAEMPYSATLRKKYESKNIVFVSISSESNMNDWLKAIKEESLDNANSFLFLNFENSSFKKKYKITSIPRYMLVGKDSKIITDDAPRPSDPKLKELINKLL